MDFNELTKRIEQLESELNWLNQRLEAQAKINEAQQQIINKRLRKQEQGADILRLSAIAFIAMLTIGILSVNLTEGQLRFVPLETINLLLQKPAIAAIATAGAAYLVKRWNENHPTEP